MLTRRRLLIGLFRRHKFNHHTKPLNQSISLKSSTRKFSNSTVEIDQSIEKLYEKKTPIDHVLLRPDTYVGSIQQQTSTMWIYDSKTNKMEEKSVQYIPALIKIFDEILVNAADNKQRSKSMNEIKVTINPKNNQIIIQNNGKGIPILHHKEHNCYIPELVLGNLLTGSNFNDSVAKITGGRNGYGAKLTNIFSTTFEVEIVNKSRKLKYYQKWNNNMGVRNDPIIEKLSDSPPDYTKVTFYPDLSKFGLKSLNDIDTLDVMFSRVRDLAGCLDGVDVYLNDQKLPGGFNEFINSFPQPQIENKNNSEESDSESPEEEEQQGETNKNCFVSMKINDRWKIGVGVSNSHKFQQVSFVNGINTYRGGTHVNYITDQITAAIASKLSKQDKNISSTLSNHVKQHLFVFVNALIENPAFSSQTKETLTTRTSDFGSECNIPPRFINSIMKDTEISNKVLQWVKLKQTSELNKGKKGKTIKKQLQIPKLDDANWAGGKRSDECTLILTEGDSAKALAIAGLSILGRDKYGVFPLKGKLLNVRDASHSQLVKNQEISSLVEILGLNYNSKYESSDKKHWKTRYGNIMLMTDQDHDGSHIKGLIINFIHHFWPNLLKNNFFYQFITPIMKVSNQSKSYSFFTIPEYKKWKDNLIKKSQNQDVLKKWNIKYYKGLGTNTSAEAKEYFKNLPKHKRLLSYDELTNNSIELAFSKSKSEDRKKWILEKTENESHHDSVINGK